MTFCALSSLSGEERSSLTLQEGNLSYEELVDLFEDQKPAAQPKSKREISLSESITLVTEEDKEATLPDALPVTTQYSSEAASKSGPAAHKHHKRWLVDAEFLYWKINKGNVFYAIKRENQPPMNVNLTNTEFVGNILGKMERPQMNWQPGVRVSLGHRFDRDAWELIASYTYYRTTKSDHSSIEFPGADDQMFNTPNAIVPAFDVVLHGYPSDAFSKIKFGYMIEDLRLARLFKLTPYIDLRLFFGLQGAQITQKWKVDFAFLQGGSANVFSQILDRNKVNWSFKGLGGNLGFDTTWHFFKGLGLFAKASFSALYGTHKTRLLGESNNNAYPNSEPFDLIADSKAIEHRPVYATQFGFGTSWEQAFKRSNVKLSLSYESISWQNLNGDIFAQSYPGNPATDLDGPNASHTPIINDTPFNLSGLTAGLHLEF